MDQTIQCKSRKFEPDNFVEHYQPALRELIAQKFKGKLPAKEPERRPAQVINLMEALKRSLAEEEKSGSAPPRVAARQPAAGPEAPQRASRGRKAAAPNGQ